MEGRQLYKFSFTLQEAKDIAIFSEHTPEEFQVRLLNEEDTEFTPVSEHYFNPEHEHDDEVSSVAVELPGFFDLAKINPWMEVFLQIKGIDPYRIKGVVGLSGEDCRFVFQGVLMMFGSEQGQPWGDEEPFNRIVFIGKDLDEGYIRRSLKRCLD